MDPTQQAAAMAAAAAAAAVQQMAATMQPALSAASRKTVNLPTFWTHNPAGWFQLAEAELLAAHYNLEDRTCYVTILRALSQEVLLSVHDLTGRLSAADVPDAYLQLKQALITRYSLTQLQHSFRLLSHPALGDRRPIQLFADMHQHVPETGDTLLNALYLQRLPERLRVALTDKCHLPPRQLAEAAELMFDNMPETAIAAMAVETKAFLPVGAAASVPAPTVAAATPRAGSTGRWRGRSPARRPATPGRQRRFTRTPSPASTLCWYHYNFKSRANRCQAPCSWRPENE
jgi:hypothetical protein